MVQVTNDDGVLGLVEQRGLLQETALRLAPGDGGLLLLGDVLQGALHLDHVATRIAHGRADAACPDAPLVTGDDLHLFVEGDTLRQARRKQLGQPHAGVGRAESQRLVERGPGSGRDAIEPADLVRPSHPRAVRVERPATQVGGAAGDGKQGLAVAQPRLTLLQHLVLAYEGRLVVGALERHGKLVQIVGVFH